MIKRIVMAQRSAAVMHPSPPLVHFLIAAHDVTVRDPPGSIPLCSVRSPLKYIRNFSIAASMSDYNYSDVLLLTISDPNPVYTIQQVFGAVFESTVEDLSRPSSPVSAQAPAFGMSSLKIEDKASDPAEQIKKRSERYRERALERLKEAARDKGGNGVIGVKCEYTPSGVSQCFI